MQPKPSGERAGALAATPGSVAWGVGNRCGPDGLRRLPALSQRSRAARPGDTSPAASRTPNSMQKMFLRHAK